MKKTAMLVASIILLVSMGMSAMAQSGKNSITASWTYWNRQMPPYGLVEKPELGAYLAYNNLEEKGMTLMYDRKWTNILDWGVYLTINKVRVFRNLPSPSYTGDWYDLMVNYVVLSPGISVKAHLLPLAKIENNQWDLYMRGKIGGTFFDGFGLDWGAGMGVQYFPWKYIGITAEANWGKYDIIFEGGHTKSHFQSQLGVTFRW